MPPLAANEGAVNEMRPSRPMISVCLVDFPDEAVLLPLSDMRGSQERVKCQYKRNATKGHALGREMARLKGELLWFAAEAELE